jgi:hypothetical protein
VDVDAGWRAVSEEYRLSRETVCGLFDREHARELASAHDLPAELVRDLTRERATVSERDLRARSYELAA